MLEYLKQEANKTLTENGAVTYETTGSDCLDLFATIGALRNESDQEIIARFIRAYAENPDLAMKLLFFGRDIRGGLGERRTFRVILNYLAFNHPESVRKNLSYVAEFGRFDDLLVLLGTPCEKEMLEVIRSQFESDMEAQKEDQGVSLLGKWLPSVNASNEETKKHGKKIAKALGLSDAEYRKALSALRSKIHIIENNLREKDYSFDYEKQPSRAMFKYRMAFARNDSERYYDFLDSVSSGEKTLHAGNVAPYELVEQYFARFDRYRYSGNEYYAPDQDALNATWKSLPDYCNDEDVLAIIDTSGSMYGGNNPRPVAVALSLGLYLADHNKGAFRNHFIEFSSRPQLIEIKGENFCDKMEYLTTFNEVADTSLEAVFDLILAAAVENNVPQSELPGKLVIVSDMEFNYCVNNASATNFENAQKKFESYGYRLPQIVFWNAASRNRQQPVTMNEQGVALVSGVTPRLFEMVSGGIVSPYVLMMDILEKERYAKIVA